MIPLIIKIEHYNQEKNYCVASLVDGQKVLFDPFVSCAIHLTDDDYESGKGKLLEGKTFAVSEFAIGCYGDTYMVCPDEGSVTEIICGLEAQGEGNE